MTAHDPPTTHGVDWLESALTVLALRLRHEVALHRALRGSAGQEGFSGLLLNGEEAEAMLAEMAGQLQASGTAVPMAQIAQAEQDLQTQRLASNTIWHRLHEVFNLDNAAMDLMLLAAAPAIDPRFGRVFGFLNDDLTRRYLTPAVAHRLLDRHQLDLAAFREYLHADGVLSRNALLRIGSERPLTETPLRMDDDLLDQILRYAPKPLRHVSKGVWVAPAEASQLPSDALRLWAHDQGAEIEVISAQRALASDDPLKLILCGARDAVIAGKTPCVTEFDQLHAETQRRLAQNPPHSLILQSSDPALWFRLGGEGQALSRQSGTITPETLTRDHAFSGIAAPVHTTLTLDDLVLPQRCYAAIQRLRNAAGSYRDVLEDWGFGHTYGKAVGFSALFKGPPGTGKTTAAAALAQALEVPLYRANIAGVVSKYIGETEKHLDKLFDAAARHKCALVFEEADALFGKRSEVSDAHDRYANQGTAYLLQRLEAHEGLCLMTTNMLENVDPAFLRRIDVVIDFPAPSKTERKALWQRIALTAGPLAGLDFDWLSGHDLTGAEIRNACLDAAYAACARGDEITMTDLAHAIADTLTKKGKPVMRANFGAYFSVTREGAGG